MAFKGHLRSFLSTKVAVHMPNLDFFPYDGRIPKGEKLQRIVRNLLQNGHRPSDAVIALTDIYTGTNDFDDAADAKAKMRKWVGPEPRFFPHVAQFDFEAWLLPYWADLQRLAGHNRNPPSGLPERVNHNKPPSRHIAELFATGSCGRHYSKVRDASRIFRDNDLAVAVRSCAELEALVNTIVDLATQG